MDTQLDPDGRPVSFGGIAVRTPGLTGTATLRRPGDGGQRGGELGTGALLDALAQADAREEATLELSRLERRDSSRGGRGGGRADDDIVVEVPVPADGEGQLMLHVAEDGVASWHFPEQQLHAKGGQRARAVNTYRVPAPLVVTRPAAAPGQRGVVTTVASKIFKIIAYPLVELGARKAGAFFARKFEQSHRKERWRRFTVADYCSPTPEPLGAADWEHVSSGRTLLFLHGTGAMAHTAFARLNPDVLRELTHRYDGRVLALDHFTLSVDPQENVTRALRQLPAGVRLDVDIVSHSRGGLVGRELAERAEASRVAVSSLVMVGTPNAGTALVHEDHLRTWLDAMTNIAQFVPDNPVTDIVAIVLTVAKHVALGALSGLAGLTSMDPGGTYLRELNVDASPRTEYFAIGAEFEPTDGSPLRRLHDTAIDLVFAPAANDLVVPTAGVGMIPGLVRFAPASVVLDAAQGVDHSSFFASDVVTDRLRTWLLA